MKMHRWTGRYEAHLWVNGCKKEGQARKGRQVPAQERAAANRSIPVTSKNSVVAPSESSRGLQVVKAALNLTIQHFEHSRMDLDPHVIGPLISCCEAAWIRVDLFSRMLQSSDYGVSREFSSEDDNIVYIVKI
ncbi:hypothetical protein Tco_1390686 [Tanacetum coccineum]